MASTADEMRLNAPAMPTQSDPNIPETLSTTLPSPLPSVEQVLAHESPAANMSHLSPPAYAPSPIPQTQNEPHVAFLSDGYSSGGEPEIDADSDINTNDDDAFGLMGQTSALPSTSSGLPPAIVPLGMNKGRGKKRGARVRYSDEEIHQMREHLKESVSLTPRPSLFEIWTSYSVKYPGRTPSALIQEHSRHPHLFKFDGVIDQLVPLPIPRPRAPRQPKAPRHSAPAAVNLHANSSLYTMPYPPWGEEDTEVLVDYLKRKAAGDTQASWDGLINQSQRRPPQSFRIKYSKNRPYFDALARGEAPPPPTPRAHSSYPAVPPTPPTNTLTQAVPNPERPTFNWQLPTGSLRRTHSPSDEQEDMEEDSSTMMDVDGVTPSDSFVNASSDLIMEPLPPLTSTSSSALAGNGATNGDGEAPPFRKLRASNASSTKRYIDDDSTSDEKEGYGVDGDTEFSLRRPNAISVVNGVGNGVKRRRMSVAGRKGESTSPAARLRIATAPPFNSTSGSRYEDVKDEDPSPNRASSSTLATAVAPPPALAPVSSTPAPHGQAQGHPAWLSTFNAADKSAALKWVVSRPRPDDLLANMASWIEFAENHPEHSPQEWLCYYLIHRATFDAVEVGLGGF